MDRIKEVDSEKCPQIDDRLDDLLIHQLYQTMRAFFKKRLIVRFIQQMYIVLSGLF